MSRPLPWFVASGKKIVGIGRNFADHAKELVLDIAVRMMTNRMMEYRSELLYNSAVQLCSFPLSTPVVFRSLHHRANAGAKTADPPRASFE